MLKHAEHTIPYGFKEPRNSVEAFRMIEQQAENTAYWREKAKRLKKKLKAARKKQA